MEEDRDLEGKSREKEKKKKDSPFAEYIEEYIDVESKTKNKRQETRNKRQKTKGKRQKSKDSPFAKHIEEDIDVDGKEYEKVKTLPTVFHRHPQQPGPGIRTIDLDSLVMFFLCN